MQEIHGGGIRRQGVLPARPRPVLPGATQGTAGPAASSTTQKNRRKAKKLLQEAGYTGQPVRWITTREYQWMYKNAIVAKQQLEAVGFKIELQDSPHARSASQQARASILLDGHHVQP